jgi:hypothetical protein
MDALSLSERTLAEHTRARELARRTVTNMARALELAQTTVAARRSRARTYRIAANEFRIEGTLEDGTSASALFWRGRLDCDRPLRSRAEILVDLGERFSLEGARGSYAATLDGPPLAIALTLIRAMRVESFEFKLTPTITITQRDGELVLHRASDEPHPRIAARLSGTHRREVPTQ